MSREASEWALRDPWIQDHVSQVARSALIVFADHANTAGEVWISQSTLAAESGWSERALRDGIRVLQELRHPLGVGPLVEDIGSRQRAVLRRLNLPATSAQAADVTPAGDAGVAATPAPPRHDSGTTPAPRAAKPEPESSSAEKSSLSTANGQGSEVPQRGHRSAREAWQDLTVDQRTLAEDLVRKLVARRLPSDREFTAAADLAVYFIRNGLNDVDTIIDATKARKLLAMAENAALIVTDAKAKLSGRESGVAEHSRRRSEALSSMLMRERERDAAAEWDEALAAQLARQDADVESDAEVIS